MGKKFKCSHKAEDISTLIRIPSRTKVKNFESVASYFMYNAPNIDCIHSQGIIEGENAETVFNRMIDSAGMENKYKMLERIQEEHSWSEYKLEGDLLCMKCSRMTCNRYRNESNLTALLRHIRNALAHGLIYVKLYGKEKTASIMLEDEDRKGKKTARIVVSFKQLETWKAILENEIATGE